jgi:hypothetical protein
MTHASQRARELILAWMDRCLPLQELLEDPKDHWLIESLAHDLTAALLEREREVWEQAAQVIEGYQLPDGWNMSMTDGTDPITPWLKRIIDRCRAQVK